MSPTAMSVRNVAIGLGLGIVATLLTYGHGIGLGFALFALISLAALAFNAKTQQVIPAYRNMFILLPMLFFLAMLVIRSDAILTMLNIGAFLLTFLLFIYFFNTGSIAQQSVFTYPVRVAEGSVVTLTQPFQEIDQARQWVTSHKGMMTHAAPFVRGAAITAPVMVVFVVLLSSADQVFADVVTNILNSFVPNNTFELFTNIVYTALFAWVMTGSLAFAVLERKAKRRHLPDSVEAAVLEIKSPEDQTTNPKDLPAIEVAKPFLSLGFTETNMLLGGILAVFGLFVGIQFVYLFGGERNIANFSYAEYARRGFAELVMVGVLTLGISFTLNEISIRQTRRRENIFRTMILIIFVLTGVILSSAFLRLRLYEITYGFTSLRLAVYVAIICLGILFAGFTLSLYWRPAQINVFGMTALFTVLGFVAALDILNPDSFVAWANIERGDIDPLYMATLSEEAIPALVTLVDAPEPGLRTIIRNTLATQRVHLIVKSSDWRAYNLGRSTALASLEGIKDKILVATDLSHRLSDFDQLHYGQTIREVVRLYGYPRITDSRSRYGSLSEGATTATLSYRLIGDNNARIDLVFDTSEGLTSACEYPANNCLNLPK